MMLDNQKPYIFSIEDLLSKSECKALIRYIEDNNPTAAPVLTFHGEAYKPDIRNNQRVMKKDQALADKIFARAKHKIPKSIFNRSLTGLNELFRCYRYKPGMRFATHADHSYERSEKERSYYTALIYLNEVEEGGDTAFIVEPEVRFSPKPGRAVIFQHPLIHEGCEVVKGTKYVLRTDIMYRVR